MNPFLSPQEKEYRRQMKIAEMQAELEIQEKALKDVKATFLDYADEARENGEATYSEELLNMAVDLDFLVNDIRFIKMQLAITTALGGVANQLKKLPEIVKLLNSAMGVYKNNSAKMQKEIGNFLATSQNIRNNISAFRKASGKIRDPKLRLSAVQSAEYEEKLKEERRQQEQRLARKRAASYPADIPAPVDTPVTNPNQGGGGVDDIL